MTHYPRHSQTFLIDEVRAVNGPDLEILPIALNPPGPGDVTSAAERHETARTFYVKDVPRFRAMRVVTSMVRRDPLGVLGVLARSLRASRADMRDALWRVFYFVEAVLVWDHCERNGCRHLHAQFGTAPAAVSMLAAELGSRLTTGRPVTWSYSVHGYTEFTAEDTYDIVRKTRSAAFVVGVSDYTRSQLMRLSSPRDWGKLHRIHCGIDLERFAFCPRRELHTPPTILTVGRLSPEKGQFGLLDGVAALLERGVDVRAKVVGDGPSGPALHERARDLGIEDRVRFTGALPATDVAVELRDADVFCLPSFAEGIPVSVMEALATGVPVVATAVGGVPELVESGVSGCTVPAGRPDLLADAIEGLLADPELRARVQQEGRRRVEAGHDLRDTAAQVRELLLEHA